MFGLLGPVQVQIDARPVHVGGPRSQTILTALLIEPGRVVSTDRLVDIVWDEHPPASARTQVQNRVSALRRLLREAGAADAVAAAGTGYVARVSPDQVDAARFDQLVERAVERAGRGQDDDAMATVTAALALWRGPAMDGLDAPPLLVAARRLNERRLDAQRLRLGLRLRQGDYAAVVADLAALLAEHPWHEGVAGQLMTALYLAQRQNDALAVFDQMRARLADQLGVDPSPELVRLRDSVLRKEITPDAALPATGTVTVTPPDHDTRSGPLLSREPAPPPRLIPADLADFTGRTAEIQRLVADRDERAVTVTVIHGLAGVGKTALAVHVAHRLRHRFPGAQLYVDLRGHDQPLDPAEALAGFLRALGISGTELPDSLDERAARFRAAVAGRPCLVLLDNAANAAQVRPLLPGAAATVLVTSRRALFDLEGAAQVRLGPLRPPEGLGLFAGVIGAARVAREPGAAARIVRGCGLLPLAVRICAARLAARPHVPLAQTADQLADLAARLDHLQTADRSVRAVFETSYRALAPPARRLLRRLASLDAEDAPAWLAATALGTDPVEAEDALAGLVEANLVEVAGPDPVGQFRCRMHDLVKAFARERARSEEAPQDLLAALADVCAAWLALAEEAATLGEYAAGAFFTIAPRVPRPPAPTDAHRRDPHAWFAAERACLLGTIAQARAVPALRRYAWPVVWFCEHLLQSDVHPDELATVCGLGLAAAQELDDPQAVVCMRVSAAFAAFMQEDLATAFDHIEHARRVVAGPADTWLLAEIYGVRGQIQEARGDVSASRADLQRAIELYQAAGDRLTAGLKLARLGDLAARQGDPAAGTTIREGVELLRTAGAGGALAHGLRRLGQWYDRCGEVDRARAAYLEALELTRRQKDQVGEMCLLGELGALLAGAGRTAEAAPYVAAALDRARAADMPLYAAYARYVNGRLSLANGDAATARRQITEVVAVLETNPRWHVAALVDLARAADRLDDREAADEAWRAALAVAERVGAAVEIQAARRQAAGG